MNEGTSLADVLFWVEMGLGAVVLLHGVFDLVVHEARLSFTLLTILGTLGFVTPALLLRRFRWWPLQVIPAVALIVHVENVIRAYF